MLCDSELKRVKYIWVPKIMIDHWVHRGYTKLNMVKVFGKESSAEAVNSQVELLKWTTPVWEAK